MAMNPVDGDLAGAYKRHGGPLKAWKHFGKSRLKKAKARGQDMVSYFQNKMKDMGTVKYDRSEYLKNAGKKGSSKGVDIKAKGMKKAAEVGVSKAIRGKMNDTRMKRTRQPMKKAKSSMPMKSIEGKLKKAKLKEKASPRAKTRYAMAKARRKA